jgi:hypothetical protein
MDPYTIRMQSILKETSVAIETPQDDLSLWMLLYLRKYGALL